MKIIIPASGTGQRFLDVGYKEFKPLIPVIGTKTIIDYVIESFDKNNDEFFFISSPDTFQALEDHLKDSDNVGLNYKHLEYNGPKLGPVGSIIGVYQELSKYISDTDQVIVSYCDYGMKWNYSEFLEFVNTSKADGIIPCYIGYHPHLKNEDNVYAVCKTDEYNCVYTVYEKYKSDKRHLENWSAGLYYFSRFDTMKLAFDVYVSKGIKLNGEYYVSLAYNEIVENFEVLVFDKIEKFYQFGTPNDFEYVKNKLNMLEDLYNVGTKINNTVILSAGKGERFLNLGFNQPKPFIPLGDSDFISRITDSFKNVDTHINYVGSEDHKHFWNGYDVRFVTPNKIGAAYSYSQACSDIRGETLIVPCDLVANYTTEDFFKLKRTADAIIFTAEPTEFAKKNITSFAWVTPASDNAHISDISIKELNAPLTNQSVLIGSFWVRKNEELIAAIAEVFRRGLKTNNEYYLDDAFKYMLKLDLSVKFVKIDKYFSLGTYEEYIENQYWLTA